MIELKTSYTFSQVPYLTYDVLEEYAEKIVADFAPERLHNPGQLDVDRFIEFYLGLDVKFHRICYDRRVLGMTAFNDGYIDVANEDTGLPEPLLVEKGMIVIDTSLNTKRNVPRMRFTMMHEGAGHWMLHRKAFSADNPFGPAGIYENQYLAAKEGRYDYSRSKKEKTDIDRMERQADFLAAAVLIPRPAIRNTFREFFELFYDEKPRRIIRGTSLLDDCYAKQLPKYVEKVYNVSNRVATIRLEKLTAIVDKGWPHIYR